MATEEKSELERAEAFAFECLSSAESLVRSDHRNPGASELIAALARIIADHRLAEMRESNSEYRSGAIHQQLSNISMNVGCGK